MTTDRITAQDRQFLISRYPILTTTAEHECFGDLCPCWSVLEVLEEEWQAYCEMCEATGDHDEYVNFYEFVAYRVGKMRDSDGCECGDSECRADHNFETSHEALWHDRI